MKTCFSASLHLLIVLSLSLAACAGGTSQAAAPGTAPVGDPAAGQKAFAAACASCHGMQGEGVPGLSKDLTQSQLVAGSSDQVLVEFIKRGGPADGPAVMLPKGGNAALDDDSLYGIVAYIRTLQN
jgi:mono/diheme cytochrome c family protein